MLTHFNNQKRRNSHLYLNLNLKLALISFTCVQIDIYIIHRKAGKDCLSNYEHNIFHENKQLALIET